MTGVVGSIGKPEAGKTYGIRSEVFNEIRTLGTPFMVFDRIRDWNFVPNDLIAVTRGTHSVALAAQHIAAGAKLVIVRTMADPAITIQQACQWALTRSGGSGAMASGIAFAEAHRAWPNRIGGLTEQAEEAVTQWRHHRISFYFDTQRLALVNTTPVEVATRIKLYAVEGPRDLLTIRKYWNREVERMVWECTKRANAGEPGWYVCPKTGVWNDDGSRSYTLERDP